MYVVFYRDVSMRCAKVNVLMMTYQILWARCWRVMVNLLLWRMCYGRMDLLYCREVPAGELATMIV